MTEYDFSPEARERYLATQNRIARWVDQTNKQPAENPFVALPGEHGPVASGPPSSVGSSASAYTPPPHYPNATPQYQQQYVYGQYPNVNPYGQPQPYPAYYTTAQGVISPTYASASTKHSHKSKSKHKHKHSSGSRSLHTSPPLGSVSLPKQAQLAYPMMPRSISTPPSMMVAQAQGQTYIYPGYQTQPTSASTTPYTSPTLQQMNAQSAAAAYPFSAYPYSAHTSPGPSPYSSPPTFSYSRMPSSKSSSAHHSPRSHVSTPTGATYGNGAVSYLQPSPNQPVVVPIGGDGRGGYVVVPAAGQHVQVISPQYQTHYARSDTSDRDGQSFFGSLNISNFKKGKKKKSRSRRDSY